MSKITLDDLSSLANEPSAVATLNNNNRKIEQAIEEMISRKGEAPNAMEANFDMNGKRIINLPKPLTAFEPLRLQELNNLTVDLDDRVAAAATSAEAAATSADNAAASESAASGHASAADSDRIAAQTARTDAQTARTGAETAETNAEAARDKAQQWAEANQNVQVEAGKYSAKHWALTAAETVGVSADGVPFAPAGNISANNVGAALRELDTEKLATSTHTTDYNTLNTAIGTKLNSSAVSPFMISVLDDTTDAAARSTLKASAARVYNSGSPFTGAGWVTASSTPVSTTNGAEYELNAATTTTTDKYFRLASPTYVGHTVVIGIKNTVVNLDLMPLITGATGVKLYYRGTEYDNWPMVGFGEKWMFIWSGTKWIMECLAQPNTFSATCSHSATGYISTSTTPWSYINSDTKSGNTLLRTTSPTLSFTAPVNGIYHINAHVVFTSFSGGNTSGEASLTVSSAGNYAVSDYSFAGLAMKFFYVGQDYSTLNISGSGYMDAGSTRWISYYTSAATLWMAQGYSYASCKFISRV